MTGNANPSTTTAGALPPHPRDLPQLRQNGCFLMGRLSPPLPFRPLSRRSGSIPGEPYPPLRYFQSGSTATSPSMTFHRTAITPLTLCLTPGVHFMSLTGGVVNTAPLWAGEMYFFRMWIENTGQQRAERVQIFVAQLLYRHQDGIFRNVESFLPMNLRWANAPANTTQIFADINPSMGKHCDLGAISDPSNTTLAPLPGLDMGNVSLDLALEVLPNSQSHRLTPGCYRLELRIGGANVTPISRTVEVTFSGRWYPVVGEMFANGIGIKEV